MNEIENGNKIIRLLDTVGFMGPFILLGIGIWQLWYHRIYWCSYLLVFAMNSFIVFLIIRSL